MKKLFGAFAWLFLTMGVVLTSAAVYQFYYGFRPSPDISLATTPASTDDTSFEELNLGKVKGMETIVETADARAIIIANFLQRYESPLQPYDYYGRFLVDLADKNNLDFRLLPAIAMQESNLCKRIPENSYNCLGFGIHSKGTLTFETYEANFERAAREIKKFYVDEGRHDPIAIMRKYTPGSNGSWAESVNQWLAEMRYDDRNLGQERKANANLLEFTQPESPLHHSVSGQF